MLVLSISKSKMKYLNQCKMVYCYQFNVLNNIYKIIGVHLHKNIIMNHFAY
jgi:hypothetical protein